VDIRADIYSLGGTLYYFLAGRSPFEHGTVGQKLEWHQTKPPPPPLANYRKGVPDGLVAVLDKMLAKNPDDRYRTPTEVVEALAPWGDRSVPPPTADEMPKLSASAYRLGLSPPPSSVLTRPIATAIPPLPAKVGATPIPPVPETEEVPTLAEPPVSVPRSGNRGWLIAAAVALLAAVALALWLIFGGATR